MHGVRVCDMLYRWNKERTGNDIGTFLKSVYLLILTGTSLVQYGTQAENEDL